MSSLRLGVLALAALATAPILAQGPSPVGDEQTRWWTHVRTLADDSLEGRQTGTDGYRKAAAYVAGQFERAGVKPAGTKGYFQPVQFTRRRIVEAQSRVALVRGGNEDVLRFGDDVTISLRAELTPDVDAPMVFAGYGISAPDFGHDDLAGLDLQGKVAVFITGTPAGITGAPAAHYQNWSVRWPALAAAGAIGAVSIPNPKRMEQPWEQTAPSRLNPVMTLADPRFNDLAGMKVNASVNPASADRLFAGSGRTVADLLALASDRKPLPTFALPSAWRARVALESAAIESDNVAALLPGADPALAREHVVLTAHLDHVGIGAEVKGDRIYNGAMDNASGVATLLEVARQLATAASRPKRSVLFVAVTAEEHGLLGSRYFAGDPTVPKASIVANINMDMFLPLFPMKSVMVLGLDESDLGDRVREVAARSGLSVMADSQPERNRFTRSDQYSFIRQGVPALAMKVGVETGSAEAAIEARWTKERYHRPSDDLQQPIDLGAAVTFTRLVGALSAEVANHPTRPQWKASSFFKRFESTDSARTPREWRDYAGGPDSSRFVGATQISKENVARLQVAWTYPDGDTDFNPLVVRDVIYTRAGPNKLVALDAATGAVRWMSPEIKGFTVRGVNYWESADGKDRRLLLTALNMLRAFDASTGQPIASFGRDGAVDLREGLDRDPKTVEQQSRLPGKIFENLIILGSATNQEYASAPGDIRAFDVRTGAHVWSFRTIPRKGEFGADTWPEDARSRVGGANAWAEMSVDAARGIVYVPTGSAKYNFFGGYRRGDNLFADSLLALDARTGTRLWHFQTVHHDIWDLDNNSAPQLTTIVQDGRRVDVVAMAGKTGYLYVFDRVTGKPIWPIEERPVPQSTSVPGQYLSPTQPIPTRPEPFSRQSFTAADLNPYILTDEQRAQFRERLRKARNEGPFTPIGFDEVVHMPGNQGGSNWGSTASSPGDGRVYVIGFNVPTIIRLLEPGEKRPARAGGNAEEIVREGYPTTDGFGLYPTIVKPPYTTITAYDLNAGAIAWQKGLGDDLRLLPLGITGTGSAATVKGGLIVTAAGLLFATAADRKVHVYDTSTGGELATLPLGGPTSGGPSMYEHGGRQYLLVTASPVQPSGPGAVQTPHKGPTGLIAYALPR